MHFEIKDLSMVTGFVARSCHEISHNQQIIHKYR